LPSLYRLSRRCAVIAIAAPPPSLPSLRPIASIGGRKKMV
jgi:hypothetical protein